MKEKWKPIVGYEGFYEVSNLGNVRSLDRIVSLDRWGGEMKKSGKVLSIKRMRGNPNYCAVALYSPIGKRSDTTIHRLVATAFIKNPLKKPQVNHIDGDPSNNQVDNLEWNTASENVKHSFSLGRRRIPAGETHGMSVLKNIEIQAIRLLNSKLKYSRRGLSELFRISTVSVNKIINNKSWTNI